MKLRLRLMLLSVGVTLATLVALGTLVGTLLWRVEVAATRSVVAAQADALIEIALRSDGPLPPEASSVLLREGRGSTATAYEGGRRVWQSSRVEPSVVVLPPDRTPARVDDLLVATRQQGDDLVRVARSLEPAIRTLERYILVTAISGLLLAGLAGLVTALAVRRTLKPLEQLAARVRHLDDPAPVPGTASADEVGALARALAASLDELRARRAREELFLANASHELRTPVTALLADIEQTRSRPRAGPELEAALDRAGRAASRLRDLTGDLLTITRARLAPDRRPFDLFDLAGDVVDRLQPLAVRAGLTLFLDGEPVLADVDAGLVTRALENLVGNAIKFTPSGEVNVTVRATGGGAELVVEDTGPGLPAVPGLFEPFSRGDTRREGFGLGLAVVREVVEAHGGRVRAESRVGGGSRFEVVLPLTASRAGGA